jgi:hypothetical protein
MAWTLEQMQQVESAIIALSTGAQEYTVQGRTVKKASLADLRNLLADMKAELGPDGQGRQLITSIQVLR